MTTVGDGHLRQVREDKVALERGGELLQPGDAYRVVEEAADPTAVARGTG